MKQKRVVSLIIVFVMLAFVVLYMIEATNGGRQLSEHEIERQHSGNMPIHTTSGSTLPVNADEGNITSPDIVQEHLQVNDQLGFTTGLKNNTLPLACISQWLHDVITVNETLHCIEVYVNKTNASK